MNLLVVLAFPFQDTIDLARSWAQRAVGRPWDAAGAYVGAEDVDLDGYKDLLVGCPSSSRLYVIYGPIPDTFDMLWPGSRYTVIAGEDSLGTVAAVADFNQDGYQDIAFSQIGGSRGKVFIALGPIADSLDTRGDLAGQNIVLSPGLEYQDMFGCDMAVGDFNNDGYPDLAVGAPGATYQWRDKCGKTYIIEGRELFENVVYLDWWHWVHVILGAIDYDMLGTSVASGDFNNDGIDDIAIGATGLDFNNEAGGVWVIFGNDSLSDTMDMVYPHGFNANLIMGHDSYSGFGSRVKAGDFNGDGTSDLAISAYTARVSGAPNAGEAAVVFFPMERGTLDVALAESGVAWFMGSQSNALAGWQLATGRVNQDHMDDLLLSAPLFDVNGKTDVGQSYLVLAPFPDTTFLDQESPMIYRVFGPGEQAQLGRGLALVDMDMKNGADLLLGAPNARSFGGRPGGGIAVVIKDSVSVNDTDTSFVRTGTPEPTRVLLKPGPVLFFRGITGWARIRVYDATGRLLWARKEQLFGPEQAVDIPVSKGVFLIRVDVSGTDMIFKIAQP